MRRLFMFSILGVLFTFNPAMAQITVSNTFDPSVGTILEQNTDTGVDSAWFAAVTSGTGGPMTWDLSAHTFGDPYHFTVVSTASTPDIGTFPGANLVLRLELGSDTTWSIHKTNSSVFWRIGLVTHGTINGSSVVAYQDSTADWVFPVSHTDQWTSHKFWVQQSAMTHTDTYDTTEYSANAYGTIKYQAKTVPCLRVMSEDRLTFKTFLDSTGELLGTFTSVTTTANFVAAGFDIVATVSKSVSFGPAFYQGYATADFLNQSTAVSESKDGNLPAGYALEQNYPNPFNPTTMIEYTVPLSAPVTIDIFNVLGQKVQMLVSQTMPAGSYRTEWNGVDFAGNQVSSGVYLYRFRAGDVTQTKAMLLLK